MVGVEGQLGYVGLLVLETFGHREGRQTEGFGLLQRPSLDRLPVRAEVLVEAFGQDQQERLGATPLGLVSEAFEQRARCRMALRSC